MSDVNLLGCRPIKLNTDSPMERAMANLPVYHGSIESACQLCGREVYVGPKQQEMLGKAIIVCFPCVIAGTAMTGISPNVKNLGNRSADHRN